MRVLLAQEVIRPGHLSASVKVYAMHGALSCCSADAVSVKSSSERIVQVMPGSCTPVAAGSPAALALACELHTYIDMTSQDTLHV